MTLDVVALYKIMLRSDPERTKVKRGKRLTGTGMSYMYRVNSNAGDISVVLAPGRNKSSQYEKYL